MFRRRPLRRPPLFRRRPPGRPPLPPGVRRALAKANHLMAVGQFAEAADIFGQLSEQAEQRGMLVRAGDLALLASRAHFAAEGVESALEWARQALRLFVRGGRVGSVPRLLSRITAALQERGYDAEADQLEREAERMLGQVGLSLDQVRQQVPQVAESRGTLPARCSGCGASLVPDEVEWHDPYTAECLYCGTVVKATLVSP
jgi:hypothetical protein